MDFVEILRKTPLFKDVPASELKKLAALMHDHTYAPGNAIFEEGENGDELFIIVMGTVRVLKNQKDGTREEVARLGTGSYFGEIAFVADEYKRTATIEAQEKTTVATLHLADLEKVIEADDRLGKYLYRAVAQGLARRLSITTQDQAYYKALALRRG